MTSDVQLTIDQKRIQAKRLLAKQKLSNNSTSYGTLAASGETERIAFGNSTEFADAPIGTAQQFSDIQNDDVFDTPSSSFEEAGATFEKQSAYLALVANAYGLIGDDEINEFVADRSKALASAQARQPEYMKQFTREFEEAKGFFEGAGVILNNPRAIGRQVITQSGNAAIPLLTTAAGAKGGAAVGAPVGGAIGSVVPVAGTAAGTATGTVVGSVVGGTTGAFVGGSIVEIGAEIDGMMQEMGVDVTDANQVLEMLQNDDVMNDIKAKAERKGITTASVDALFQVVGGRFLKAAKIKGAGKVATVGAGAADIGVQSIGEGVGEAAGQYAKDGKVDFKDAALEAVTSLGQSAGQTAIGATSGTVKTTAENVIQNKKSMDGYLSKIAQVESGNNPLAQNPNSSAKGKYQFIDSTGKMFGLDKYEFGTPEYTAAEEKAVRKLTKINNKGLKKVLGRPPTEGELYLAHQQGLGGAKKLLQNPNALAVDVVGEKQVKLNGGDANMTAQEFANKWISKVDGESATTFENNESLDIAEASLTFDERNEISETGEKQVEAIRAEQAQIIEQDTATVDSLKDRIDRVRQFIKSPKPKAPIKKPLIDFVKKMGGVQTGSTLAGELKSMGINTKTAVDLFKKKGMSGDLDNIPITEWRQAFPDSNPTSEDGTYVDRNFILEQISNETFAKEEITAEDAEVNDFVEQLDRMGLDIDTVTPEELFEAIEGRIPAKEQTSELDELGPPPEPIITEAEISAIDPEFADGVQLYADEKRSLLDIPSDIASEVLTSSADGVVNIGKGLEKILSPISTRISNINEKLAFKLRRFEMNTKVAIQNDEKVIIPFLQKWKTMNIKDQQVFDLALKNGNDPVIDAVSEKYDMAQEISDVKELLDGLFERASDAGININYRSDFFPRNVNDVEGLLGYLRKSEGWSVFNTAFDAREKRTGDKLTTAERAEIVNVMLRGFPIEGVSLSKKGIFKDRSIEQVNKEINQFYDSSDQSLIKYLVVANESIEVSKLFGKGIDMNGKENMDDSVGSFVDGLLESGEVSSENAQELKILFNARFNRGRMGPATEFFRDAGYVATMGSNIGSTITQIGDTFLAAYKNGLLNAALSLPSAVTGNVVVDTDDVGVTKIAQEFESKSLSSKVVETSFKLTGLSTIDRIGKRTLLESSFKKNRKLAKKADKNFMEKLDIIFEAGAAQVAQDFIDGNVTEDVKFVMFNDLLDMQPVALSEMPEQYLKAGNGKLFYMLKTFTIKQLDIYRRDVFREIKVGTQQKDAKRVAKGVANFTRLMGYMVMAGATRDLAWSWLTGREPDEPDDMVVKNMLKAVGLSKYTFDQMAKPYMGDDPSDALFGTALLPPTKTIDNLWRDMKQMRSKKGLDYKDMRSLRSIPVGGELYYFWFGGGSSASKDKNSKSKLATQ